MKKDYLGVICIIVPLYGSVNSNNRSNENNITGLGTCQTFNNNNLINQLYRYNYYN